MNTKAIKTNLIDAINQTNDPSLLLEMSKLIDMNTIDAEVVKLTAAQIREIELAIEEVESGKFKTHEDHQNEMEGWLKD